MKKILLNNNGFALIAALMAMLVLTAVGALVLTITTKDIRVASRVVGEKMALSAEQSGMHGALMYFNRPEGFEVEDLTEPVRTFTTTNTMVDTGTDPYNNYYSYSQYSVSVLPEPKKASPPAELVALKLDKVPEERKKEGYDNRVDGFGWKQRVVIKTITGRSPRYNSQIVADVGIGVLTPDK